MHRLSYTGSCWLLPREGHSCVTAFLDFEILFRSVLHNPYFSKDSDSREGGLEPLMMQQRYRVHTSMKTGPICVGGTFSQHTQTNHLHVFSCCISALNFVVV